MWTNTHTHAHTHTQSITPSQQSEQQQPNILKRKDILLDLAFKVTINMSPDFPDFLLFLH
jgi:hypothetical protein